MNGNPFCIYETNTGKVLYSGISDLPETLVISGQSIIIGEKVDDPQNYYVKKGKITKIPDKTGNKFYVFDTVLEKWLDPRTVDDVLEAIRFDRDVLLTKCDWTQLPDVPVATKYLWATYRQALRDITNQTDPFNIVWPTPPN